MLSVVAAEPTHAHALDRARDGDHDAFAELIAEHESMVFGIAYHCYGNRDRAEETAQDVFLQLYRNLREIQSPMHLVFWLRQVTTRRCIDQMRRARMRPVALEDIAELHAVDDNHPDPYLETKLRELVAGLPEAQRVVVTLRFQEDLDPSEICRIVNMPVNTVKSHLHRALLALRKKLGDS